MPATPLTIAKPGDDFTTAKVAAAAQMSFVNEPSRPVELMVFNNHATLPTTVTFVRSGTFADGTTMTPNRIEAAMLALTEKSFANFPVSEFGNPVVVNFSATTDVEVLAKYQS